MSIQPHTPIRTLLNTHNIVIHQRIRIAGLMFEYFELIAIIAVQARRRAKPHKAIRIFENAANAVIRKTVGNIEMRKLVNILLCVQIGMHDEQ